MKNIKLIINGKITDTTDKFISYVITKQISDFNDITKRTGSFSYTIKLPKSKNNKQIFRYIDDLDVVNKFNITTNFDCQLYVNDTIIIDGIFILREVSKDYFEGNIVNKFGDIYSLIGNKTLQDLSLPEIDFEGIMLPVGITSSSQTVYNTLGNGVLNSTLGFDFRSLTEGYKDPSWGLTGSSIDYRDYYKTSFVQYSNFAVDVPEKNINTLNAFINNFNINNFMPQIKYKSIINQIFKDIGYNVFIDNDLINDDNLIVPYTGPEAPNWNWLHLSKVSLSTDIDKIEDVVQSKSTSSTALLNIYNQFTKPPLCSSRQRCNNRTNILKSTDQNQFTDNTLNDINDTRNYDWLINSNVNDNYKLHYMATNKLNYDFNNNFSFFSPAPSSSTFSRDTGWIYTVPTDGEYEFDLDIDHDIKTSQYYLRMRETSGGIYTNREKKYDKQKELYGDIVSGYDGATEGNNTWSYNSFEKYYIGNLVGFIKTNESDYDSIIQSYNEEFTPLLNSDIRDIPNYKSSKLMRNWNNENIIGYYSPMLRDLYHGNFDPTQLWEEYIQYEGSILVNPNPIPTDYSNETDVLKYFGFSKDTQILNFENKIGYDPSLIKFYAGDIESFNDKYPLTEQYKRKMVRLKKKSIDTIYIYQSSGITTDEAAVAQFDNQPGLGTGLFNRTYYNYANGNVKFKFKTKLKKGDQIRMVYFTANQMSTVFSLNNHVFTTGTTNWYSPLQYNDSYFDEYKINHLKVRCISDDLYTEKLKLSNFLPKIKQSDFLDDLIKSNNLYFDVIDNDITFKSRNDFYKKNTNIDITPKMNKDYDSLYPTPSNKGYLFGYSIKDNYDFYEFVKSSNPPIEISLDSNNKYLTQEIVDVTSKIFFNTFDRSSIYSTFPLVWQGKYTTLDGNPTQSFSNDLTVPSFQEGGDSKVSLSESNDNYNRANRILYWKGPFQNGMNDLPKDKLIGSIPFKHININQSVSNEGLLLNTNKYDLFNDQFLDLQDSSQVEWFAYLDELTFASLDLSKPVIIKNTLYYIQKIDQYNPLNTKMTKLLLLKI